MIDLYPLLFSASYCLRPSGLVDLFRQGGSVLFSTTAGSSPWSGEALESLPASSRDPV